MDKIPNLFGYGIPEHLFDQCYDRFVKCKIQLNNGRYLTIDDFDTTTFIHQDTNNDVIFFTIEQVETALRLYSFFYKKFNLPIPSVNLVYFNEEMSEAMTTDSITFT